MRELEELKLEFEGCSACALGRSGANFVFGVGDPGARVLVIGEAPGFHEDRLGEPFVGAAGKLLDELLGAIGLSRKPDGGVYIANVLKHRPPENRDPTPDEMAACRPILDRQVEILAPDVIVTVGNFATKAILETEAGITRMRGRVFHRQGRVIFPTFHPAAALRSSAVEAQLKADFRTLAGVLADRATAGGPDGADLAGRESDRKPAAAAVQEPAAEQLGLF